MKHFRTVVSIKPSTHLVDLKDRFTTIGSCFADAIGSRLQTYKLHTLRNPFGVLYNPHSIHKALRYAIFNEIPPEHTFLQQQDVHLNYDFHSEFSALNKNELHSHLRNAIGSTHSFLKDANWLVITYGTAWVYSHTESGEIVANCHKMPAKLFHKSLLSPEKIAASFQEFHKDLKSINPNIRITLTVSPVRHIKDTLELNTVSKSVLRLACHSLSEMYENVEYFPAFEIMMDELRDYRFYKSDMLHPTEEAEEYIWEKFGECYFNEDVKKFVSSWNEVLSALAHKPFHPTSAAHQNFLKEALKKLETFRNTINVEEEIQFVVSLIETKKKSQTPE